MLDATLSGRPTLTPVTKEYNAGRRDGYAHAHDMLEEYVAGYLRRADAVRDDLAIAALRGALATLRQSALLGDLIGGLQG